MPDTNKKTLSEDIAAAVVAPFKIFEKDAEDVSARAAAIAAIGYFVGGVMVGDRFGDSIPLIGQGR